MSVDYLGLCLMFRNSPKLQKKLGYHIPTKVTKFYMTSSTFIRFEQVSGAAVCLSCLERVWPGECFTKRYQHTIVKSNGGLKLLLIDSSAKNMHEEARPRAQFKIKLDYINLRLTPSSIGGQSLQVRSDDLTSRLLKA